MSVSGLIATSRVRTLIFHPALAPYRVDLFNELSRHLDLKVIFLNENLLSQKFDQERLRSLLEFEYGYVSSGVNVLGHQVRWGMARAISQFKPQVVVTPEYSATTLMACLIRSLRFVGQWGLVVLTVDNVRMSEEASVPRRLARRVALGALDAMIVYTQAARRWYTRYAMPYESIGVCPNIHNQDTFRKGLGHSGPMAERLLRDWALSGKRVVLSVCRLVGIKGVDQVIRSFARVTSIFPDAVLVIIGDGPEKQPLERLAAEEGVGDRAYFPGRFEGEDLLAWYLLGHVFVLSSNFEPFGAVVNEALVAGMPVLCSSAAGASDLIREGENGHVFDPYDVSSLTKLLAVQLENSSPLRSGSIALKENLMPISFQDGVRDFVRVVEYAARPRGKSPYRG